MEERGLKDLNDNDSTNLDEDNVNTHYKTRNTKARVQNNNESTIRPDVNTLSLAEIV
jgi:hypothetical protein